MSRATRCKFRLTAVKDVYGQVGKEFTFSAMYDDTIPEDRRFQQYTPWGTFSMVVDNPAVTPMFVGDDGSPFLGKEFYFDISPVPALQPITPPERAPQPA
jgi:hypothetical protein